jgi:hypothetical protein
MVHLFHGQLTVAIIIPAIEFFEKPEHLAFGAIFGDDRSGTSEAAGGGESE